MRLILGYHAKIFAIHTMEPLQYRRTFIFIHYIIIRTNFFLDGTCFNDPTAQGTCLLHVDFQCVNSANSHQTNCASAY